MPSTSRVGQALVPCMVSLLTPSQNFIFMVLSSSLSSNPLAPVPLAPKTFAVSTWNVPWIFTWLVTSLHFFSIFVHTLLSSWSFPHYLPYPFQSLLLASFITEWVSVIFSRPMHDVPNGRVSSFEWLNNVMCARVCVCESQFFSPFIHQWTLSLFPYLDCCK